MKEQFEVINLKNKALNDWNSLMCCKTFSLHTSDGEACYLGDVLIHVGYTDGGCEGCPYRRIRTARP